MNKVAIDGHSRVIYLFATLIFVLMLSHAKNTSAAGMKLSESDSGKTSEISVGDELEIVLPGNPTTGYVWEVSWHDANILKLVDAKFYADLKAIGAGGTEIVKFCAIAEGKSEVKLIFHRPFEHNVQPLKTFTATIIIRR